MFRDRIHAGRLLAEELSAGHAERDDTLVLGIPRGGVVLANEVARRLSLPLDIIVTSKIGAPGNPEYAIGAVDPDGEVTPNPYAGYSLLELQQLAVPVHHKIESRLHLYRGMQEPLDLKGKTVILVDDGIATGLTVISAIAYLRRHGAHSIVVAVPVIAAGAAAIIRPEVDELVALEEPEVFYAVGQFYRHFDQVSDDEVLETL
ncbi:MAG: phosphoribosyltransferase [Actinobacteria bacterium HGW-Actinobacteria-9]|nr:MAG: phosphoribosyltransferase [Actinobacteria bacterium HGW-Actinobacteria-9]